MTREDIPQIKKSDRRLLFILAAIWLVALCFVAWDFLIFQANVYIFSLTSLIGLILFLMGVIVRIIARLTLRRHFTHALTIVEGHVLVKHGIYRYVRHPAYTGSILIDAGLPLIFSSILGFLAMLIVSAGIIYRIRFEEAMLIDQFGDEYRFYMKNTKRLVPFLF